MRRIAVIIPARFGAQRFPGKLLADLAGKPVIAHTVERARRARGVDVVAVATDDERVAAAAARAGAEAIMTGPAATGTDRVAEAVKKLAPRPTLVINVQGDEPLIEPEAIETLIRTMEESGAEMGSLMRPIDPEEVELPQVGKVVTDLSGNALYFSRAPIPFRRAGGISPRMRATVGIYGYTPGFLERFATLSPGLLEQEESLEQLRALEHGIKIRLSETTYRGFGIDTPEDLERARALLASGRGKGKGTW
ncbi:MAG TPA: 3-deoxy-manno-octulosonate cytidylyltransferase [Anaeromyxobacter sp.]|nr:3-deoxy-manno-octulosonate cytidylyltransferase [Anaeromyxobacter sp.]